MDRSTKIVRDNRVLWKRRRRPILRGVQKLLFCGRRSEGPRGEDHRSSQLEWAKSASQRTILPIRCLFLVRDHDYGLTTTPKASEEINSKTRNGILSVVGSQLQTFSDTANDVLREVSSPSLLEGSSVSDRKGAVSFACSSRFTTVVADNLASSVQCSGMRSVSRCMVSNTEP